MDLDSLVDYEFVFRAVDQDGAYCRYEALLSCTDPDTGLCYLIYADEMPDEDGNVMTYASLCDEAQVTQVAAQAQPGCTPRRPPVLDLRDPQGDAQWDVVHALLSELERQDLED